MANDSNALQNNPGEIKGWPTLKIDYPTDPEKIAALLPPTIEPADTSDVHLSIYQVPVPDEPEFGCVITVDAQYQGKKGTYCLCYAIDQESAVHISQESTGQPKYLGEIEYYRLGDTIRASVCHHKYTFLEFKGKVTGAAEVPESVPTELELWIKSMRSVNVRDKSFDFPPHVVTVKTSFDPVARENVEGELILRDSPWDPIADYLPQTGDLTARLVTNRMTDRQIELAAPIDPIEFWPHVDTIGTSRWPGAMGGPLREIDFSTYLG